MAAEIYAHIGAAIRRRRDALGLSQAQLADRVGLIRTSITMIERGAQALQVHQLIDIAKALRVSPDKLLDAVEVNQAPEPNREEAAEALELLSDLEPIGRITR